MTENVDWECQNCGEYYRAPRDRGPQETYCGWCREEAMWEIADHDQTDG